MTLKSASFRQTFNNSSSNKHWSEHFSIRINQWIRDLQMMCELHNMMIAGKTSAKNFAGSQSLILWSSGLCDTMMQTDGYQYAVHNSGYPQECLSLPTKHGIITHKTNLSHCNIKFCDIRFQSNSTTQVSGWYVCFSLSGLSFGPDFSCPDKTLLSFLSSTL